jgi:class 3 adenylate cyclase
MDPRGCRCSHRWAFVGTVGEGDAVDFTALGDSVNTAARLASGAKAGEMT